MSATLKARPAPIICAHLSPNPQVLSRINEAGCNLAVWERPAIAGVGAVLTETARDLRFTATPDALAERLPAKLAQHGFAEHSVTAALAEDISSLAHRFCAVTGSQELELRLEVVTTNSCRKFHADYVPARLITTYHGTGTQWVDQSDAERLRDGKEPRAVRTLAQGDVGIFKGKLATSHPAIHRSPPIEGTGERRLLLVLNVPESQ